MKVARYGTYEWDPKKEKSNIEKHQISFITAIGIFQDPDRIIRNDLEHSQTEARWMGIGKVNDQILTIRFTYRGFFVRIIGAGNWRKGWRIYEKENSKK